MIMITASEARELSDKVDLPHKEMESLIARVRSAAMLGKRSIDYKCDEDYVRQYVYKIFKEQGYSVAIVYEGSDHVILRISW